MDDITVHEKLHVIFNKLLDIERALLKNNDNIDLEKGLSNLNEQLTEINHNTEYTMSAVNFAYNVYDAFIQPIHYVFNKVSFNNIVLPEKPLNKSY